MTLFSDESNISKEVSIDYYENKVAIYDDYGDDMCVIKNNDNHDTCHHDFNFQSHDSYFVEFASTTIHDNKFSLSFAFFTFMLQIKKRNNKGIKKEINQ